MDTVFKLPFELKVIRRFPEYQEKTAKDFCLSEKELWDRGIISLQIEENDDVEMLFMSDVSDAMLYLEALDIIPDEQCFACDENGYLYRRPSPTPFTLYKSDEGFDALRVDIFRMVVKCEGKEYFGAIEVVPKPVSTSEWKMMRDDLECEMKGLAQDIVRKNIGLREPDVSYLPPDKLYNFLVIQKYIHSVSAALADINEKPRNRILTVYEDKPSIKAQNFDKETMKRYVRMAGTEATLRVPIKTIDYDIQDNRLLKFIIIDYEKKLDEFIIWIEKAIEYDAQEERKEIKQYKNIWWKEINDFKNIAKKLRRTTGVLKTKEWYKNLTISTDSNIPHSFVLDSRYNILYRMHNELKNPTFEYMLDSKFSYSWKRSSLLYEMWCFIKVCRILSKTYDMDSDKWNFNKERLFPFFEPEMKVKFENDTLRLEVIYDQILYGKGEKEPLRIVKNQENRIPHNRPDIVINIFYKKNGWYLGTVILECKYRKLSSFWNGNNDRSSLEQFQTYLNNARSNILFGSLGHQLRANPVRKVIVLTPDSTGDNKISNDFEIVVKALKPSDSNEMQDNLEKELEIQIAEVLDMAQKLYSR